MLLSNHFSLSEFIKSSTADKLCINNTPPLSAVENLRTLCTKVLEPARLLYGKPIVITSGYRCQLLNARVGGKPNSQHRTGMAADLRYNKDLYEILKKLPHDQLILEKGENTTWIHVSYNPNEKQNRNQTFTLNQ